MAGKTAEQPLNQIKCFSGEQLRQVIEEVIIIGRIYDLMGTFKETLFAKKTENLEDWIKEALAIESDEIISL